MPRLTWQPSPGETVVCDSAISTSSRVSQLSRSASTQCWKYVRSSVVDSPSVCRSSRDSNVRAFVVSACGAGDAPPLLSEAASRVATRAQRLHGVGSALPGRPVLSGGSGGLRMASATERA